MMMTNVELSEIPCADAIRLFKCGDPDCGPHLILYDENDTPICQMIIPREHVQEFAFHALSFIGPVGSWSTKQ